MNPRFKISLVIIFTALVLAACGFPGCMDALGCIEILPGSAIEIGVQLPSTNINRAIGMEIISGVESAKAGKSIKGFPVKIRQEPTTCLKADLPASLTRLSSNENLVGVIGPACPDQSEPFFSGLNNSGKVVFSSTFQENSARLDGVFHISPTRSELVNQLVRLVTQIAPGKVIILLSDDSLSGWNESITQALKQQNITIIHEQVNQPLEFGGHEILSKFQGPVTILIVSSGFEFTNPNPWQNKPAQAQSILFTPTQFLSEEGKNQWEGWTFIGITPPAQPVEGSAITTLSFDAAVELIRIIEQSSTVSLNGSLLIPRQKLRQVVRSTPFLGKMGAYNCADQNTCQQVSLKAIQVHQGQVFELPESSR